MESIYPKLALCGGKNECARTDTVFFRLSEVSEGMVSHVFLMYMSSQTIHCLTPPSLFIHEGFWVTLFQNVCHHVPESVSPCSGEWPCSRECVTLFQRVCHLVPESDLVPESVLPCYRDCVTLFQRVCNLVPESVSPCSRECITLFKRVCHLVPDSVSLCSRGCATLF